MTRRQFLKGSFGSLVGLSILELVGCGSGGSSTGTTLALTLMAGQNGSIRVVMEAQGYLLTVIDSLNDEKVRAIGKKDQSQFLLGPSDSLVFEVNGQKRVTGQDSVTRTIVQTGDQITWKVT